MAEEGSVYHTDLAQHMITAGQDTDDLNRDVFGVSNVVP